MVKILNKEINKIDLLRRVGNLNQLAGVKQYECKNGRMNGLQACDFKTGNGLSFTVLQGKCLDISNLEYKGINLNFITKPGLVAPEYFNPVSGEFGRYFQAGMLYTCGLRNVGAENNDNQEQLNPHGRIGNTPAENVSVLSQWRDNEYIMSICGQIREGSQFAENILLDRKIETSLGSKSIKIIDIIENQGFEEQPFMMLYHFNFGYPLLDKGLKVIIPSIDIESRDKRSEEGISEWEEMVEPTDGFVEQVYYHKLGSDKQGNTCFAVYNTELNIGMSIKLNVNSLPYLIEWKSMMSGDYTLGLEPANCHVGGRSQERSRGTLRNLASFEKVHHNLEMEIIDGIDEFSLVEEYIKKMR